MLSTNTAYCNKPPVNFKFSSSVSLDFSSNCFISVTSVLIFNPISAFSTTSFTLKSGIASRIMPNLSYPNAVMADMTIGIMEFLLIAK